MNTALMRRRRDDGFTLVELITVIVIVGVLAAIAVPLYLDQQKRSHDAATKTDLTSITTGISAAIVDGQAVAPTLTVSAATVLLDGESIGSLSPGVVLGSLHWTDDEDWCIDATHPDGDHAKNPGYKFEAAQSKVEVGQCA